MKRSKPLKRGKPLARGPTRLKRKARLKARTVPRAFRQRRDPRYTDWVRSQPCLLLGHRDSEPAQWGGYRVFPLHTCLGPVQVCHVRSRGAAGADRANVVPLCAALHEQQHLTGIRSFQLRWAIDLAAAAAYYDAEYRREAGAP